MKGNGTTENPFIETFNSVIFKKYDSELFLSICERDDGFELIVIPVTSGPNRHYRINPDGTFIDLVKNAKA